ncbi:hypothetical protein [Ruminococcus sp.]|uniref:hypothetical protein n=1 Tax=Ruminococcus sp. TaxID=41978 RepID=UPI003870CF9C
MTNTKFRKRALLSSVAMLLVALVALGSATFAWFTANPDAEAHGISMKTTAAAGLVIRTTTDTTWSHHATLNKNGTTVNVQPASQEQSAPDNFWTVIADNSGAYGAKSGEAMTAGAEGSAFYKEDIYCRLSDGSDASANASKKVYIKGVTITPTAGVSADESMKNAMRVSIARGTTMLGTWALSTAGANGTLTTAAQTPGSFSPALASTSTALNVDTGLTALAASGTDTTKYITVYVWLDGQDSVCYSDKVGTVNADEIISSVQVDLTLA